VGALRALFVALSVIGLLAAARASAVSAKDAKVKLAPAVAPSPPPANSTIYIIRQKAFALFSTSFEVMVDGQKAADLLLARRKRRPRANRRPEKCHALKAIEASCEHRGHSLSA
jgi:hypothetical protein